MPSRSRDCKAAQRLVAPLSILACTGLLTGLSVGCASLQPGDVAEKWSATMRELQMVPVFPPREDVKVGDIYFLKADTPEAVAAIESRNLPDNHTGFLPIPILVGRLNLGTALDQQYTGGPMFGDTDPTRLDPSGAFALQPVRDKAFTTGANDRPRIVGFPEFMSATYSSGDLSALVPIEAINLTAAIGFTAADKVTVPVPVAESYVLPLSSVLGGMLDQNGNLKNVSGTAGGFVPAHVSLLTDANSADAAKGDTVGFLRVINEVYMARVVDVSITGSASFGAAARAEPIIVPAVPTPTPPEGPPSSDPVIPADPADPVPGVGAPPTPSSPSPPSPPSPGPSIARAADGAGPEANPIELANRLNAQLDQQMTGLSPGVTTRFVTASAHSIGMRTTYERPVAIGYRGVLLRLVKKNDDGDLAVGGILSIDSMQPTEDDAGPVGRTNP